MNNNNIMLYPLWSANFRFRFRWGDALPASVSRFGCRETGSYAFLYCTFFSLSPSPWYHVQCAGCDEGGRSKWHECLSLKLWAHALASVWVRTVYVIAPQRLWPPLRTPPWPTRAPAPRRWTLYAGAGHPHLQAQPQQVFQIAPTAAPPPLVRLQPAALHRFHPTRIELCRRQ